MNASTGIDCSECGRSVVVVIVLRHGAGEWPLCCRCYFARPAVVLSAHAGK